MSEDKSTEAALARSANQGRSPAFPFVPLARALARADELRAAEGKNGVPITSAYRAWGFGGKSSGGRQTAAALRHFGLLDYVGRGEERDVRLTRLALDILLDARPHSPERDALIRRAALNPPIHAELWRRYGVDLPSDATFATYLVRDRGFNETGARDLLAEYKDTLAFAKLIGSAHDDQPAKPEPAAEATPQSAEDGGRGEAGRAERPPRRSAQGEFQLLGERSFAADASSAGGEDMGEAPAATGAASPAPGMRQDVFALDEGEVLIRWPEHLSPESYEDFEHWLRLVLRRAKRSVRPHG
jgi:hypothetical protein